MTSKLKNYDSLLITPASYCLIIFKFRVRELILDVEKILLNRVTDSSAASGANASLDVAAGIAAAIKIISGGSLPQVSFPLGNILKLDAYSSCMT